MLLINFIITSMFLSQHCHSSKKALDRLRKCQKGEMFCGDPHWHQDEDNGEYIIIFYNYLAHLHSIIRKIADI